MPLHSRGTISPELCNLVVPLLKRGRRECRVHAAPAVSCAKNCAFGAHEHTGSAETLRHPPRNGFTAYFVLSPVERACCHRHPREALASARLGASIAAPGPHDFAVRSRTIRLWNAASIASRAQRVVTMAIRPSGGRETAMVIILIFRNVKRNILLAGLTAQISLRLLRKLDSRRSGCACVCYPYSKAALLRTNQFAPSENGAFTRVNRQGALQLNINVAPEPRYAEARKNDRQVRKHFAMQIIAHEAKSSTAILSRSRQGSRRIHACCTNACKALTAASRPSTGTNRLTECGDRT